MASKSVKKLIRYLTNPNSLYLQFYFSRILPETPNASLQLQSVSSSYRFSAGWPTDCFVTLPFRIPPKFIGIYSVKNTIRRYPHSNGLLGAICQFRWFSIVSDKNLVFGNKGIISNLSSEKPLGRFESRMSPKKVVEVIRNEKGNCVSKLNSMGISLSVESVTEIFQVLNSERISAFPFFEWLRVTNPDMYYNANICSLIIDNCGRLNDYETVTSLLEEFKLKEVGLKEKAFEFLLVLDLSRKRESIRTVVEILDKTGGSCGRSGICVLIEMLCKKDSFEMAEFVMEITETNLSHYGILIRERCRRGQFEEIQSLLGEMRKLGCNPDVKIYNYLFGSLCKNNRFSEACSMLEGMLEKDTPLDATTFEIFISHSCRLGKLDVASELFNRLMSMGHESRSAMHAAFVKGYFNAGKYEEAYKYVRFVGVEHARYSNKMYSLLAMLHEKEDPVTAQRILIEMMDSGLRPDYLIYKKIVKKLTRTKNRALAGDLRNRFSRLTT